MRSVSVALNHFRVRIHTYNIPLRSSEIAWSVLVETRRCFVAETIREARVAAFGERERERDRREREEKGGREKGLSSERE